MKSKIFKFLVVIVLVYLKIFKFLVVIVLAYLKKHDVKVYAIYKHTHGTDTVRLNPYSNHMSANMYLKNFYNMYGSKKYKLIKIEGEFDENIE